MRNFGRGLQADRIVLGGHRVCGNWFVANWRSRFPEHHSGMQVTVGGNHSRGFGTCVFGKTQWLGGSASYSNPSRFGLLECYRAVVVCATLKLSGIRHVRPAPRRPRSPCGRRPYLGRPPGRGRAWWRWWVSWKPNWSRCRSSLRNCGERTLSYGGNRGQPPSRWSGDAAPAQPASVAGPQLARPCGDDLAPDLPVPSQEVTEHRPQAGRRETVCRRAQPWQSRIRMPPDNQDVGARPVGV